MQCVIQPVIELTTEDREALLHNELMMQHTIRRVEKLETALFRPDKSLNRNIFDDIDDQINDNKKAAHKAT